MMTTYGAAESVSTSDEAEEGARPQILPCLQWSSAVPRRPLSALLLNSVKIFTANFN